MVQYRVLGSLEVAEERRFADLGPPKQRALLAILLLHSNEIVPVERLIDLLWPDRLPRRAGHAIQVYVSGLRRALEPLAGSDVIAWQSPGYVLRIDPDAVDANLVERLTAEGAQLLAVGDLAAADLVLGRARELWRGAPLAEFVYEEFAQEPIRHLTDTWLQGTEILAEVKLGLGDDATALSLAEAAIREDPLRERSRRLQLLSLYRTGRAAEALRAYESFRQCLADELGVEPSPELQRLHEAILIRDPALGSGRDEPDAAAPRAARNPYKGLRAFGEADADDFFGREALVHRLLDALAGGSRLVTLVGPSGSGKSSVLSAGLIPALRSAVAPGPSPWVVVRMRPGTHPLEALRVALSGPMDGELLLVIDQLEEAFDPAADSECGEFLASLTRLVTDDAGRARAVLALRADCYDRPLLHATFAEVFLRGVAKVVPMTAAELEAAVVEPARRVGVSVEPALLAELVSDTIDRPGALPLLQHVLADLFERRADAAMTLDGYRDLGGLRGALSSRAESAFKGLDADGREVARQIFLRLVQPGEGRHHVARRADLHGLTELAIDPVVLSGVLRRLEAERLVTIDRDPVLGASTVEVAHEALLTEWDRLATWIDRGRNDLRQHAGLAARVDDWLTTGRGADDLLTGSRLDEYDAWARETTMGLTIDERAFIDASLERRRVEDVENEARAARERRMERRARTRLVAFVGAAALLVAAVAYALVAWPGRPPDIVLVYPGPGDGGMYDSIGAGFADAVDRLDLDAQTVIERPADVRERLRRLSEQGVRLIVVASDMSNPDVEVVARDHSATSFIASDYWGELPNVATPRFAVEEGAFLVGAAAALKSSTGKVGIIGESDDNTQWWYVGGFQAGARAAHPDVEVLVSYLPEGPVTFVTVNRAAREMFRSGVDVVFYPGRSAPLGLFEAASSESEALDRQLWAIAIDTNWYVALPLASVAGRDTTTWRSRVLTSLVARYDLAISTMLEEHQQGRLAPGERWFGVADGTFELPSSGGFLGGIEATIESLEAGIVSGMIDVPRFPPDRGPPR